MASTNIFDLLNDDAPDQTIQIPAVKKEVKPAAAKPAATATKPADNKAPRKDGARGGKPRDGDDRAARGPRFDRAPRDGAAPRAPRGGRNAPRNGRHGGFDRHSGTGIVDSENKENKRLGDPTESSLEAEKDAATEDAAAATTPEPVEPEAVVKTLDDYLAEKAAKAVKISLPETRAANAGSDDSQWKNAEVLCVEETGDFIKMGKESVAKARKGKKESKVLIKDIEVRFTEPAREPAAPRAPRGAAVNVDDQELFPSLGSK
ncbi:hypothetical protein BGX21_001756 [Mortierella sp. AD011]|nr:hypothetical protein BGX21_001756 [Mortierella sp. AD011]